MGRPILYFISLVSCYAPSDFSMVLSEQFSRCVASARIENKIDETHFPEGFSLSVKFRDEDSIHSGCP